MRPPRPPFDHEPHCAIGAEPWWPAINKDATAVVIVFNPLNRAHETEVELWYEWFVKNQRLEDDRCICLSHCPNSQGLQGIQAREYWAVLGRGSGERCACGGRGGESGQGGVYVCGGGWGVCVRGSRGPMRWVVVPVGRGWTIL